MEEKLIEISESTYKNLLLNSAMLRALEDAGVDNWSGFDHATEIFEEYMNSPDGK